MCRASELGIAMFGVQFNAGQSRQTIRDAITLLGDMTPVYTDIGEYMLNATRQRFISGTAPDGTGWAAKSEATLERYKRLGYGSLNKPLKGPSGRLSREIQRFVSRDGVIIGSSLIYARVMNEGAARGAFGNNAAGRPIPWGRIPARQWLGISKEEDAGIVAIVEEHLGRVLDE